MKHIKILSLLFLSLLAARAQFTYTTNNNTLTLVQFSDNGSAGAVTIPNTVGGMPVVAIGQSAFFQCDSVTSVTIGTNVTSIGGDAIFQCTQVAGVSIPGSVTNFGLGPFCDDQMLTTMAFSSSNSFFTITNGALYNKSLKSLIQYPCGVGGSYTISGIVTNINNAFIGNTLTSVGANPTNLYYASSNGVLYFKDLSTLVTYPGVAPGSYTNLPQTTNIGSAAFEYCTGVTAVSLGTNVIGIGSFAFYDCTNLTSFTVNATNAYFSSANGVLFDKKQTTLLQYPSGLEGNYVVPGTVTNIAQGAFGDSFGLVSVVIPNSVLNIPDQTFYSCFNLASASIGSKVASIGFDAFYFCSSLQNLLIPDSVTNIAEFAFANCQQLQGVTFGRGLTSLGLEAFAGCNNLSSACFAGNAPVDGGSVFEFTSLPDILYVSTATGWGPTYDGINTAPCTECSGSAPTLLIEPVGTNVVLAWPSIYSSFTLQSNTVLTSSATWGNVTNMPSILGNYDVVTNHRSGTKMFFRLMEP